MAYTVHIQGGVCEEKTGDLCRSLWVRERGGKGTKGTYKRAGRRVDMERRGGIRSWGKGFTPDTYNQKKKVREKGRSSTEKKV